MLLSIEIDLEYRCENACDFLLQIEVAQCLNQNILKSNFEITPNQPIIYSDGDESIGKRIWLHVEDKFRCTYIAEVEINRDIVSLENIKQSALKETHSDAIKYLMPSRYCHLEKFENSIPKQFSNLNGGKLVASLCDWMKIEFTYLAGVSDANTTAYDTLINKQGVCRDYAHVLISMLRASAIPARMVSAYSPNVRPPDFHALVEVYLDGKWYLVDPTGMTTADEVAIIGIGRDAADISFLTAYGFLTMINQYVSVNIIENVT